MNGDGFFKFLAKSNNKEIKAIASNGSNTESSAMQIPITFLANSLSYSIQNSNIYLGQSPISSRIKGNKIVVNELCYSTAE